MYAAMAGSGLALELLNIQHVHDAFRAVPVNNKCNHVPGIAHLMGTAGSVGCTASRERPRLRVL